MKWLIYLIFFLSVFTSAQTQEGSKLVKYDKNFVFDEGIYMNVNEFRNNSPSITEFNIVKHSQFNGKTELQFNCFDSVSSRFEICIAQNCWGYTTNNSVYIAQSIDGYFFRLQMIGSLIHFYDMNRYSRSVYDDSFGYPTTNVQHGTESREFIIDMESGKRIEFNYKNFSAFLKEKDQELYQELESSKKKRKMIYYYLIKYNEKHPIYFPKNIK